MALPLPPGLMPTEVAFLCEMEMVTVVPRQRLESIPLLSGSTPPLRPPHRTDLPLWLALLLKKQRRANIVPPPWLHPASLSDIIHHETNVSPNEFSPPPPPPVRSDGRGGVFSRSKPGTRPDAGGGTRGGGGGARQSSTITSSILSSSSAITTKEPITLTPPFLPSCTATSPSGYLPYHWLELAETLLAHAADDVPSAAEVRPLLRDLQEVRAAKLRGSTAQLDGTGGGVVGLRGVGAMELAESRGFVLGVVEGVRRLGASAEASRREEEEYGEDDDDDDDDGGGRGLVGGGDSDEDMGF